MISKAVFHFLHLKTTFSSALQGALAPQDLGATSGNSCGTLGAVSPPAIAGHGMAYSQQVLPAEIELVEGRDISCVSPLPGPGSQALPKQVLLTVGREETVSGF